MFKGSPELLRVVEAKVYGMDSHEYYKIPMFASQQDVHILESTPEHNSFEQKLVTLKEWPATWYIHLVILKFV